MEQYFAHATDEKEIIGHLKKKIEGYFSYHLNNGEIKKWNRSFDMYYGKHIKGSNGGEIEYFGKNGELTAVGVNHYRSLVKSMLALSCSQKPSFDFRATNTDLESIQQARLASGIIDYYLTEKRLSRHFMSAAERALVLRTGYVYMPWNPSLGEPYTVKQVADENGNLIDKIIYEGDVDAKAKSPWEVIYDPNVKDWNDVKWTIIISYENKYDLAARYPDKAERIISLNYDSEQFNFLRPDELTSVFNQDETDTELIPVLEFYHTRTESMKNGRYLKCVADTVLYDDAFQYKKKLPILRISNGERFDSAEGYTDFYDLMALNAAYNTLVSSAYTNNNAFGTQKIAVSKNADVSVEEISKSLAFIKVNDVNNDIKPLQLTASPAELYSLANIFKGAMETISGQNSVVRGDPDHGLKSGAALGRMQAMAIQYSSNFQRSWSELQEDGGTHLLHLLQDFAKTERMIAIAGKYNKSSMKAFKGESISKIDRCVVDLGNPMFRTYAGRQELGESLLQKGLIKDVQVYLNFINTGNYETVVEGKTRQIELIRQENEMLTDGQPVHALLTDKHLLHIDEHQGVLADPELRRLEAMGDPLAQQIVSNALNHIQEHMMLAEQRPPILAMVSGEPPVPQSMPQDQGAPPPQQDQAEQQQPFPEGIAPNEMGM